MSCGKLLMEQRFALAALLLALSFNSTLAQQPVGDFRQACGNEYAAYCARVPPGGGRIIGCLRANMARLGPVCQQALATLAGGPLPAGPAVAAPVAPPPGAVVVAPPPVVVGPTPVQIAIRACDPDAHRLCPVVPGEGHVLTCLLQSIRALSPRCRQALALLPR